MAVSGAMWLRSLRSIATRLDAAGDPLLVVMAQPAASLAGELRRLIHALRGTVADVDEHAFTEQTHTDEHGRTHTWRLPHRVSDDDPTRTVPNPAKKLAYQKVEKPCRALYSAGTTRDRELLAASPHSGVTTVLTDAMINTINVDAHAAQATLDVALAAHQALPARLPPAEVNAGQQVLDTETKLIHHAIRIAAFSTAHFLARAILTDTGYTRADDEAHTLIRTALAGSGDIIPDHDTLHIRLDPRHTRVPLISCGLDIESPCRRRLLIVGHPAPYGEVLGPPHMVQLRIPRRAG